MGSNGIDRWTGGREGRDSSHSSVEREREREDLIISDKQAVGGRPPRYALHPYPPPVGAEAPSAAEQTATQQQFPTANTFSRPPLQPPDAPTRR